MPSSRSADAHPVVWIVDDSPTETEAIRSALAPSCEVAAMFPDGTALIEALSHRAPPDTLVLDWQMPGMSGIEVCQYLRGNPATMGLPVLLLTSHQEPEDVAQGLTAGANDYVFKPFRPVELVARIRALAQWGLRRKEVEQAAVRSQRSLSDEQARRMLAEGSLTELQAAEERARRMEQRYRLAARATRDVIWEWEPRSDTLELSGGQELLDGAEPGPVPLSWWTERLHPEDRERVMYGFQAAIAGPALEWQAEYRFQRIGGDWAEVMDRAFVVRDGQGRAMQVVGAMQDITERKRAEEALRRSEVRFRRLIEAGIIGVLEWREDGTITAANDTLLGMLGYTRRELEAGALNFRGLTPPEDLAVTEQAVRTLKATGVIQPFEKQYLHKRGHRVDVLVGSATLDEARTRGIALVLDITGRKRVEAEAVRRAEFEQQLVGIVSHDLKNPLSAITLAAATLLRRVGGDERQASAVTRILSAAGRASRMIHDLLDFTQARLGGGLPIQPRPCDLTGVSQQVVDEVLLAHPERQVEVVGEGDTRGTWDEDRMAQLVSNLLGNALAYSPPETPVRVALRGEGEGVTLAVHNAGAPIPPELLPRLFEPMHRGGQAVGKESRSIGLGLFIVKQVVDVHGGSIRVHSAEGEGTTFTVRLPRRTPTRAEPSPAGSAPPSP